MKEKWSWRESNPHLRDATAAHSHYATAPYVKITFKAGVILTSVNRLSSLF